MRQREAQYDHHMSDLDIVRQASWRETIRR